MDFTKELINVSNIIISGVEKKSKDWYSVVIANHYLKLEHDIEYQKDYRRNVLTPIMIKRFGYMSRTHSTRFKIKQ